MYHGTNVGPWIVKRLQNVSHPNIFISMSVLFRFLKCMCFPSIFYTTCTSHSWFKVQVQVMHFNFNVTMIPVQYGELKWKLETQREICNFEKLKHKFSLAFCKVDPFPLKCMGNAAYICSYSISTACFFGFHIEMHT